MQVNTERIFQLTALLSSCVFSWKEEHWEGCYGEDISHPAPGHRVGAAQLDSCAYPLGKLLPPHSRTAGAHPREGRAGPLALRQLPPEPEVPLPR